MERKANDIGIDLNLIWFDHYLMVRTDDPYVGWDHPVHLVHWSVQLRTEMIQSVGQYHTITSQKNRSRAAQAVLKASTVGERPSTTPNLNAGDRIYILG